MKITSTVFNDGGMIPLAYTCDGEGSNPPLFFSGIPREAKSLALIVDDPDSVSTTGKVWEHWVVFNIPPETVSIGEGSIPHGMIGVNGKGESAYQGPCPATGKHTYHFKLYALDALLDLAPGASKQEVEEEMAGHIIDSAELVGTYSRAL